MCSQFVARRYIKGDENEISDLLNIIWGGWPRFDLDCEPVDHWRWKYLDNPLGENKVTVALKGDQIVGCHHVVFFPAKIGDNNYLISQAMDLGTHPDFRRMGVNKTIGELNQRLIEEDKAKLTYFVTTSPIVVKLHKEAKTKVYPRKILNYSKIENINEYLSENQSKNRFVKGAGYTVLSNMNKVLGSMKLGLDKADCVINQIDKFDKRIDIFYNKIKDNFMFLIENSVEYLNWRYCDPRAGNFIVFVAEDSEENILGYCVLRVNRFDPDQPQGYIVELQYIPGKLEVAAALLENALVVLEKEGAKSVNSWVLEKSGLEKLFQSEGFIKRDTEIYVYYNKDERPDPLDLEKFETAPSDQLYFSYGYTDWI